MNSRFVRALPAAALVAVLSAAFQTPVAHAAAEEYSAANPPPASFMFAGPVGGTLNDAGQGTVYFRFVVFVHSLKPSRIQIVDADTGAVLVDDEKPKLDETKYKHPSKPKVAFRQWEGHGATQIITDAEPAWLHDPAPTRANLEIRVYEGKKLKFSFKQSATYVPQVKQQILHAVEFNKGRDAGK